jgi:cytochrome c6
MNSLKFAVTATTLLLLVAALVTTQAPVTRAAFDDAAVTFKTKCAMCHGMDGTGNTPTGKSLKVRDLGSAGVQKMTDAQLNTIISKGKDKMPGFSSSLNTDQIKGLVAHIRALKK